MARGEVARGDGVARALIEKYGWKGVSTRIRTQNHQSNETINTYDRVDPHYLGLWFDFIYGELYPRGIIDDRTRLLMMVGVCLALNEPVQLENHIRGAMLLGATPREVLEVIVQSTAYCGMPTTIQTVRVLDRVAKEMNRASELNAPRRETVSSEACRPATGDEVEAVRSPHASLHHSITAFRSQQRRCGSSPSRTFAASGSWLAGSVVRWLEMLALALFAYQLTGSAFVVAMLTMLRMLPMGLFGALIGAAAERLDRRRVLVLVVAMSMIVTLALAILASLDAIAVWHLAVASFVNGIGWAADHPVRRMMIGDAVGAERIGSALSIDTATNNGTRVLGPMLSGLLLAEYGITSVFWFSLALYTAGPRGGAPHRHAQAERRRQARFVHHQHPRRLRVAARQRPPDRRLRDDDHLQHLRLARDQHGAGHRHGLSGPRPERRGAARQLRRRGRPARRAPDRGRSRAPRGTGASSSAAWRSIS